MTAPATRHTLRWVAAPGNAAAAPAPLYSNTGNPHICMPLPSPLRQMTTLIIDVVKAQAS